MRKNSSALLLTSALLWMAGGAGAGEIPSPKTAPDASDLIASGKPQKAAPRASRAPTKVMRLLDEKNLGLGCAQPS